ncbi:hypothetical protein V5O48_009625 [Marasmius crinis-equi]|uniref:Oxidoreductase n=1 Tax=Marasmius crinis-equi TaxID=585013 RepID=A0ABR3FAY3_9AGAR
MPVHHPSSSTSQNTLSSAAEIHARSTAASRKPKLPHPMLKLRSSNTSSSATQASWLPYRPHEGGYEVRFGTHHVGHVPLIKLLTPTLLRGIRFDTLRETDTIGNAGLRYERSKLVNFLYAKELARRYPKITSVSVHPGTVGAGLADGVAPVTKILYLLVSKWREVKPVVGYSQMWASTTEKGNLVNGGYYEPVGVLTEAAKVASDEELAKRLWEWTGVELKDY